MTMELFFSPLACSLASRVALYEAGADATFVEVDPFRKRTLDGRDYLAIHPLGLVPALRVGAREAGEELLTENGAILEYIADRFPAARLAPEDAGGRLRLRQWLSFIATELHKAVYTPLLDPRAPEGAKAYALAKADARLAWAAARLEGRDHLIDRFSVADAYLATVLHWSAATPIDLGRWPALRAYLGRQRERPTIARAIGEERPLYLQELARHAAA